MRDDLANLLSLTLPAGATTGQRIVIDGVAGTITIFDSTNALTMRLGEARALELSSGDASESSLADIQSSVLGAGNTRRLSTVIESPNFSSREEAIIDLNSESFDGTVEALIRHTAVTHQFDGSTAGDPILKVGDAFTDSADIQLITKSLPRGEMDFASNASNVSLSTTAGTFTTIVEGAEFNGINGRKYKVSLFGGDNLLINGSGFATTNEWVGKFQVSVGGGAYADLDASMDLGRLEVAAATRKPVFTCTDRFVASATDTLQFRFQAAKSSGAATVTSSMEGASNSWKLLVEDIGAS